MTPIVVRQTAEYLAWYRSLRDERGKGRITDRVDRLTLGQFGDFKAVGEGVMEIRFHFGPG